MEKCDIRIERTQKEKLRKIFKSYSDIDVYVALPKFSYNVKASDFFDSKTTFDLLYRTIGKNRDDYYSLNVTLLRPHKTTNIEVFSNKRTQHNGRF